ncbi:MAG: tetratricopeptide repeat protein [Candidatus Eisenbacteria bacterium]|nr:tetratricopeptide repeat protein [Candidatus Eisenbacteria bacterium]
MSATGSAKRYGRGPDAAGASTALGRGPDAARAVTRCLLVLLPALAFLSWGCAGPPMRTGSDERTVRIVSHEVAKGESLETIADDFYGDPGAADYLRDVNGIPEGVSPKRGALLDVPVGQSDMTRYERRTRAKLHYNRGTLLADHGDLQRAAEEFRSALRVDPRFADAGYNLGVVLLEMGEVDRAVAVFKQAADLRREDTELLYALGAALLEAGRPSEALGVFEEVLRSDPGHEDATFSRGLALLEMGRENDAIFHLDSYVRAFPGGRWIGRAEEILSRLGEERSGEAPGEAGP